MTRVVGVPAQRSTAQMFTSIFSLSTPEMVLAALNDAVVNAMGGDLRFVSVDRSCAAQLRLFFTVVSDI